MNHRLSQIPEVKFYLLIEKLVSLYHFQVLVGIKAAKNVLFYTKACYIRLKVDPICLKKKNDLMLLYSFEFSNGLWG